MSLRKMQREYRETPKQEIRGAILENAVYGFLGSIIVVFIANRIDIAVLIGYMTYYFYVGKVINRPKYVTSLGKFIIFPVPTALGAFTGYKIAGYISTLIIN
jgi:predicted tellurium resistance membrane protein TerC